MHLDENYQLISFQEMTRLDKKSINIRIESTSVAEEYHIMRNSLIDCIIGALGRTESSSIAETLLLLKRMELDPEQIECIITKEEK